jgi:hypothetical protein
MYRSAHLNRHRPSGAAVTALRTLICVGAVLVAAVPSTAQENGELRGSLSGITLPELRPASVVDAPPRTRLDDASTGFTGAAAREFGAPLRDEAFEDDIWPQSLPAQPSADRTPPLDEATTGDIRVAPLTGFEDDEASGREAAESAIGPLELRGRRTEEDPFAPVGIRTGSFVVTPSLEQGLGWTSNAASAPSGEASLFSQTGLRLGAVSDWGRHELRLDADALYRKSISGADLEEFEGGASASLRQETGNEYSAIYQLGYRLRPEAASSPVVIEDAASRPLRQTLDASAALSREEGLLRFRLRGGVQRETFGNADLAGGGVLSQEDRNATLALASLRVGYALSPALVPFVETEIGRRYHDNRIDAAGFERSANRLSIRSGLEFDFGEKLAGELAAGIISERPDDDRFGAITQPFVAGTIAWSPLRGTVVEYTSTTTIDAATGPGDAGALVYANDITLSHRLRHNLTASALFGLDWRDYVDGGSEQTWTAEAELTWWLNRQTGITGRLGHETLKSSIAGRGYSLNSAFLGMTLRR